MEELKIDNAITYYKEEEKEILDFINRSNHLNSYVVITKGKELENIKAKISGLEVAKQN